MNRRDEERGFISLWVGLLVAITLTVAAIAGQRWYGSLFATRHQEQAFWQRSLAESTTHLALARLNASDTYAGASVDAMTVRITQPSDAPADASPWVDLAASEPSDWRQLAITLTGGKQWAAIAKAEYQPYFPALIVAREAIELQEVSTSSYHSAFSDPKEPRGGERDRWGDLVGGEIVLRAMQPKTIHGRLLAGNGARVQLDETITVTGERQSLDKPWPLPPAPAPQGQVLPIPGDRRVVLGRGHYQTSGLYAQGVGRYVFTGPVTLHIDGNMVLGPSSIVTAENRPTNLVIFCKGSQVEVHMPFSGAVFAPEADVILHGAGDFFGALVARKVRNDGQGRLVFDRALPRWSRGERQMFRLVSLWPLLPGEFPPHPAPSPSP